MDLSACPNRESNIHANAFLPSRKSWVFCWASKVSIVTLLGKKTVDIVNVSVFDQSFNEDAHFDSNMRSALLRFCWYH